MLYVLLQNIVPLLAQSGIDDRTIGKYLFAGVFAVVIVWLVMIPADRIGQAERVPPWWKNVRVWGIFVATTQLLVYLLWP